MVAGEVALAAGDDTNRRAEAIAAPDPGSLAYKKYLTLSSFPKRRRHRYPLMPRPRAELRAELGKT